MISANFLTLGRFACNLGLGLFSGCSLEELLGGCASELSALGSSFFEEVVMSSIALKIGRLLTIACLAALLVCSCDSGVACRFFGSSCDPGLGCRPLGRVSGVIDCASFLRAVLPACLAAFWDCS